MPVINIGHRSRVQYNPEGRTPLRLEAVYLLKRGQRDINWLKDANGKPLYLAEMGLLTVRFGNTHYVKKFVIAERLEVDVIIGTSFLNEHVIVIQCRENAFSLEYT